MLQILFKNERSNFPPSSPAKLEPAAFGDVPKEDRVKASNTKFWIQNIIEYPAYEEDNKIVLIDE